VPPADPNEPNDDMSVATPLGVEQVIEGILEPASDVDWFVWQTDGQEVNFVFLRPAEGTGTLVLTFHDAAGQQISDPFPTATEESWTITGALPAGTYYARVVSGIDAGIGPYSLLYTAELPLKAMGQTGELTLENVEEEATPEDDNGEATSDDTETATPDDNETVTPAESDEATPDDNETVTPDDNGESADEATETATPTGEV
jgi:hypothetical protein